MNFTTHLCRQRLNTFLLIGAKVVLWRTWHGKDLMQLEPQPHRGFLLRLIQLHNREHIKETFLSVEAQGASCSHM